MTAKPLYQNANDSYEKTDKSCLFVTELSYKHTGRDTHNKISDKVSIVTYLRKYIAGSEIVLYDDSHWRAEVGNESNHSEKRNHNNDGSPLFFLFTHK